MIHGLKQCIECENWHSEPGQLCEFCIRKAEAAAEARGEPPEMERERLGKFFNIPGQDEPYRP